MVFKSLNYSDFSRFIRNTLFEAVKSRKTLKYRKYFLKIYDNPKEAKYEYNVLKEIKRVNSQTFTVPKPLKLIEKPTQSILVMEHIKGHELQFYIDRFLLFKDMSTLQTINSLGNAFREFHSLSLNGLRDSTLPTTDTELRAEIASLSDEIFYPSILNNLKLDRKLFSIVSLHGELYFSHIMRSDRKWVFFDLHKACRGPAFYDLATFSVSLFGSLLLPTKSTVNLEPLVRASLCGYFGKGVELGSIKLAELYVVLRILNDMRCDLSSPMDKLVIWLKTKRLKKIAGEIFQP